MTPALGHTRKTDRMRVHATATRSGDWWALSVTDGLPADHSCHTQCRRLTNAVATLVDAVATLVDVDDADIEVDLHISLGSTADELRRRVHALQLEAQKASAAAAESNRDLASRLIGDGLTFREAGMVMGISQARVKQLTTA